ncbi:MAG: transposase [Candidatus Brocadia sp.]
MQVSCFLLYRKFIHLKSKKTTEETLYGITSLTPQKADPSRILQLNRGHWSIENCLHYVRDVTFHEDRSSIRTNHAPRVMASLRNCIISILRSLGKTSISQTLRNMTYKPHLVLKLLRL